MYDFHLRSWFVKPIWRQFGSFLLNALLPYDPAIHRAPPWYLPKGVESLNSHENLHADVYSRFIHNCPNLEATKMPFSINKVWYIQTM